MSETWSKQTVVGYPFGYGSHRSGYDTNGHAFDQDIPTDRSWNSYVSSASGFKNPTWRDQVRRGSNATTTFNGTAYDVRQSSFVSGTVENLYFDILTKKQGFTKTEGYGYANVFPPPLGNPSSVATSVNNRAIRKFLDRYQQIKSSIEGGQDIGEIRETLHSVLHPLNSLKESMVHYLSALKKGRNGKKSPKALRKVLSDTYLEFHFGWQPLADDIAQLIADAGRTRFSSYPIDATASAVYSGQTSERSFTIGFLDSTTHRYSTTDKYTVRYKGKVRSNAGNDGLVSVAQALRLTPENWLPTAWDLLPYSWIADYFVNIGDILQGLAFVNADLIWGCRTQRNVSTNKFNELVFNTPPPVTGVDSNILNYNRSIRGGNAELVVRTVLRTSFSGDDLVPSIEFKIPTSKYPFLNVGALLLQRSKGLVPFF
jgi:hypothetical protein